MIRLLSIELQKIYLNRASRILTLTYFVLLMLISLIAVIKFNIGPIKFHLAEMGIFNFPYIWHLNTYIAAIFKLFLAIIIVSMMANEYSYGTLKQNLIDGLSKKELLLSKFLTVVLFSAVSTLFIFILCLILGYSYSSYTEISIVFTDIDYLLAYFVKLVGFFSFCLFLGILIKRSAFALGFLLLWNIIEGICGVLLHQVFFRNNPIADTIYSFFPLEAMSNLIHEPIRRLSAVKTVETQIGIKNVQDFSVDYGSVLIVICWTAIFLFLSYRILKKRDL